MYIALTILQLLSALAVTVIVLFQSGKRSGLSGAIAGGAAPSSRGQGRG
ncbi:MAG: preprotein translocase subunit SecG [Lachnospiraceae bacterium]